MRQAGEMPQSKKQRGAGVQALKATVNANCPDVFPASIMQLLRTTTAGDPTHVGQGAALCAVVAGAGMAIARQLLWGHSAVACSHGTQRPQAVPVAA